MVPGGAVGTALLRRASGRPAPVLHRLAPGAVRACFPTSSVSAVPAGRRPGERGGMRAKDLLGSRGEELAARFLSDAGLSIIDRNWRCPEGEIDLVAVDGATLVVIEVKTRSSLDFGHPFEAISPSKLTRLHVLAAAWVRAHNRYYAHCRIDAVAVLDDGTGAPLIEHLRGIS